MRANANAQVYLRQKSPKCEMFCAIATVQNEKPPPKNYVCENLDKNVHALATKFWHGGNRTL